MIPVGIPVGIRSVAVRFPSVVRTNDYFRSKYPKVIAAWEEKTLKHVFDAAEEGEAAHPFDLEMLPYLSDIFRGAQERRALGPGESTLSLERAVAEDALRAAGLGPEDVDLLIASSFVPENLGIGDAAFLAGRLGLRGAAFNVESACAGAMLALRTAAAFVRAGEHERVLVVVSATYSRAMDESDVVSWFLGDGAGAFVVAREEPGHGLLGTRSVHTAETCGSVFWQAVNNPGGEPVVHMKAAPGAGKLLRDSSVSALRSCCIGAADAAGVRLSDIEFFVFNTPLAWFHTFAARVLEIDPARTLSTFPRYGNMGCALTTANLYHAAAEGRIREGSMVLVFGIGSVASAAATVMRWGRVGLGPSPAGSSPPRAT